MSDQNDLAAAVSDLSVRIASIERTIISLAAQIRQQGDEAFGLQSTGERRTLKASAPSERPAVESVPRDLCLAILQRVDLIAKEQQFQTALLNFLILRVKDPSHVTIAEAALILGVSRGTIHNRFAAFFEQIPGKRGLYLPIEILKDAYISAATLNTARAYEKDSAPPKV